MKAGSAFISAFILLLSSLSAQALSVGGPGGWWPKDWPKELEPLRAQTWTWSHGRIHEEKAHNSFEITFKSREQFEAMWPHLLKLRPKEVPLTFREGPLVMFWGTRPAKNKSAGIRILTWSHARAGKPVKPVKPVQTKFAKTPGYFMTQCTIYAIEIVVDGKVLDFKKIPLPSDVKVIDKRGK